MSATTVRQAVADYLSAQALPNVVIYLAEPRLAVLEGIQVGALTSLVAFPVIAEQSEKRIGFGAKQITYTVTLALRAASDQQHAEDAQSDADQLFELMLETIRKDPTLGTSGGSNPVFQAGEGDGMGSTDLVLRRELPVAKNPDGSGRVYLWAHLDITALEIIQA